MSFKHALIALLFAGGIARAQMAQATPITYSFDTSALNPAAGLYSLDFQLTSDEATTANSATLDSFVVTGGSLLSSSFYPAAGGNSGSPLAPPLVLSTTDVFNSFTADFIPGTMLSFRLALTNNAPAGAVPDEFTFAILLDGSEVSTTDPSLSNKLLRADLVGGAAPDVAEFATAAAVPEPASLLLFGSGLLVGGIVVRRRRRSA